MTQQAIMSYEHLKNYDFELSIQVGTKHVVVTDAAKFCELVNQDKSDYVTLKVNVTGEFPDDVEPRDLMIGGDPKSMQDTSQDSEPAKVHQVNKPIGIQEEEKVL